MARYYGSWVMTDDWRAEMDASVSNDSNGTTCTVTVIGYINNVYANASYFTADITSNASGGTTNYSVGTISTGSGLKAIQRSSNTISVPRGTSAKTLACKCRVNGSGGYSGYSSTASCNLTIPALTPYPIAYKPNLPSGASGVKGMPSDQTKYHGTAITLAKSLPMLDGYEFLGWATSASATSPASTYTAEKMAAGVSYTSDMALTLYAVWQSTHQKPVISNLSVRRCTSGGTVDEDGKYALLTFGVAYDSEASGNATIKLYYSTDNWATETNVALSVSSAAVATTSITTRTSTGPFSTSSAYRVRVEVTENGYTGTANDIISPSYRPIDFAPNGSVAIGKAASDSATKVFEVGIPYVQEGVGVTLDSVSALAWADALQSGVETIYSSSAIEVLRLGPIIVVAAHGITGAPSASTVLLSGTLASYKPKYNTSAIVADTSSHVARLWVNKDNGSIQLASVGYTTSAAWYGTLCYLVS